MVVPSSVAAAITDGEGKLPTTLPTDKTEKELFLLHKLYTSFFTTLQRSALYNGWVYRESNVGAEAKVFEGESAKAASQNYFVAGKTQYSNTPIIVSRNAGLDRVQYDNTTDAGTYGTSGTNVKGETHKPNVTYNAFYFRGWQTTSTITAPTAEGLPSDPADWQYEAVNRGIDGWYEIARSNGSIVRERYLGGGRMYHPTRALAATAGSITDATEYAILEGTHNIADNSFSRTPDPLGYRNDDYTGVSEDEDLGIINRATDQVVAQGQASAALTEVATNVKDSWQSSGVRSAKEDMMCVLNTLSNTQKVPLFTTSFILPTDWTQDAFADRSMRLNVTFQVMQADYLASGTSHHCSVELAESRFDDVTLWAEADTTTGTHSIKKGQPYVKNVADQPDFDNPAFWTGNYGEPNTPVTPPEDDED
jgi:hypothetical protein